MKSRQDGLEVPPYAEETSREIGTLGVGGHGNFERRSDAANRGVTPARFAEARARASNPADDSGVMEPSAGAPHLSESEERAGHGTMPDTTEKIREKAYELWVLEGKPEGRHLAHWEMARELVAQEEGLDTTLLPINPDEEEIEDAVAALDNGGEAPGLTDQGKDDSNALRARPPAAMASPATRRKAARSKA